jgi:hypothetical protein
MTMSDLVSYAPSASELLYRIGLERRRSRTMRAASCAGWLGVGMALGSGLTILMNGRNGTEIRERLADKARRAREYVAPAEEDEQRDRAPTPTAARTTPTRRV